MYAVAIVMTFIAERALGRCTIENRPCLRLPFFRVYCGFLGRKTR